MLENAKEAIINIASNTSGSIAITPEILKDYIGKDKLPTLLLYDEPGLQLFEKITFEPEYYLTNTEIEILDKFSDEISKQIPSGSILVELGSGNLRKTVKLLKALDKQEKEITYYALDVSFSELERSIKEIKEISFKNISIKALCGTYDDGKIWLKNSRESRNHPLIVMWLGSSIGNFSRESAAEFLNDFSSQALNPGDRFLIGIDSQTDHDTVWHAYNDSNGVTNQFILNGLKNTNKILNKDLFDPNDWEYIGVYDSKDNFHEAFYVPKKDINLGPDFKNKVIKKGHRISVETSWKFKKTDILKLWDKSELVHLKSWTNKNYYYGLHMVYKPPFYFPLHKSLSSNPSINEWNTIWKAWDFITLKMIPREMLQEKPINLRNACIFYLGHIPCFLDIQLSRTGLDSVSPPTEPIKFRDIFERGIDPCVEDPSQIHRHSEAPVKWPSLDEILKYRDNVRKRLIDLLEKNHSSITPRAKRAIWISWEHEAMHIETLLYMMIQSKLTFPPEGVPPTEFVKNPADYSEIAETNNENWIEIPSGVIDIGVNDDQSNDLIQDLQVEKDGYNSLYGWDNEKPLRKSIEFKSFTISSSLITNAEYLDYLLSLNKERYLNVELIPESWIASGDGRKVYVKTIFGLAPLYGEEWSDIELAAPDWPLWASYNEFEAYLKWKGDEYRFPTEIEMQAFYDYQQNKSQNEAMKHRINNDDSQEPQSKSVEKFSSKLLSNLSSSSTPESRSNSVCSTSSSLSLSDESSSTLSSITSDSGQNSTNLTDSEASCNQNVNSSKNYYYNLLGSDVGFQHWRPVSSKEVPISYMGPGAQGLWEWTSTPFSKHKGFVPEELYPEYSTDFHGGAHNIVMGGSWASVPRISGRRSFRNWYQRSYKYAWVGARMIRSKPDIDTPPPKKRVRVE